MKKRRFVLNFATVAPAPPPNLVDFVRNYEPEQERDENGRWTSGGGNSMPGDWYSPAVAKSHTAMSRKDQANIDDYIEWTPAVAAAVKEDEAMKRTVEVTNLVDAISKLPRYDGKAYRGVRMSHDELEKIKAAGKIAIPGLTSFSTDEDTAIQFSEWKTNPKRAYRVILVANNLTDARQMPNQDEYEVVTRRANFDVKSVSNRSGTTYIHLEEKS